MKKNLCISREVMWKCVSTCRALKLHESSIDRTIRDREWKRKDVRKSQLKKKLTRMKIN